MSNLTEEVVHTLVERFRQAGSQGTVVAWYSAVGGGVEGVHR